MKTLAEVLAQHRFLGWLEIPDNPADDDSPTTAYPMCVKCGRCDDWPAHVAAAWRAERTITTEAELRALPEGVVILDREGDVSQLRGSRWCGYETMPLGHGRQAKYLPARVVWFPGDGAES